METLHARSETVALALEAAERHLRVVEAGGERYLQEYLYRSQSRDEYIACQKHIIRVLQLRTPELRPSFINQLRKQRGDKCLKITEAAA